MKYEDIPKTRQLVKNLNSNLRAIAEAIWDARQYSIELQQFDTVLVGMANQVEDLHDKLRTLDSELVSLYQKLIDDLVEK